MILRQLATLGMTETHRAWASLCRQAADSGYRWARASGRGTAGVRLEAGSDGLYVRVRAGIAGVVQAALAASIADGDEERARDAGG